MATTKEKKLLKLYAISEYVCEPRLECESVIVEERQITYKVIGPKKAAFGYASIIPKGRGIGRFTERDAWHSYQEKLERETKRLERELERMRAKLAKTKEVINLTATQAE